MVAEELMRRGLHINCLPEEILIKIFSNLAARDIIRSVLPVCRLWYKLGYDPVLWKSLEFSYRSEHSCPNMIRTVTQRYGRWRSTFRLVPVVPPELSRTCGLFCSQKTTGRPLFSQVNKRGMFSSSDRKKFA